MILMMVSGSRLRIVQILFCREKRIHLCSRMRQVKVLLIVLFVGTCHPVAIVDHREGDAHGGGVLPGRVILGNGTPDAESDGNIRIRRRDGLGQHPVKADLSGVVCSLL